MRRGKSWSRGALAQYDIILRETTGSDLVPKEGVGCAVLRKKDYFDTFHECKDGNLFMGDGYPCKVEGFGTVKIIMYVGVVHTIGDVAYVPKMRKNLISLGRLDSLGCKYFVAGEAMEITRGGLILMKGRKCGGLYCWDGSAMKISMGCCWKREAVTSFQGRDNGERIKPVGGDEGASGPSFEAN
ncbi:hypothetical protein L3X38_005684 [Prunus dulcis]|uniref:Retrovirus-related Pol polyprotein from transposon TNT 1-94-like beta-barrel domain-containing protein n=1 Tax=Prunus dulcis TaxID=3755 RepID=A0AAD4ZR43_PRUDU|nr:hypothetical protein L3X38_005684 [Prunus dulcis]